MALFAASLLLLFIGFHFFVDGLTHHGKGVWTFGGDEPGTGGAFGKRSQSEESVPLAAGTVSGCAV